MHAHFGRLAKEGEADKYSNIFFAATQAGSMWLTDDMKHCSEVCKVGRYILSLLVNEKDNSVILITSHLLRFQFQITFNEKINPTLKLKLSISGDPALASTI